MTYQTNINRFVAIMNYSKNHSISKKIAKSSLWISIAVLVYPIVLYYTELKQQDIANTFNFPNKIGLISPVLLFIIYLGLLIKMLQEKYSKTDLNLLFTLSALILSVYLIMLYSRIFAL